MYHFGEIGDLTKAMSAEQNREKMAEANTPKKSNLLRNFLIGFVVIVSAEIIGRTTAGGELDQEFFVQKVIGVGIVLAIVYGVLWMVRSARSRKGK